VERIEMKVPTPEQLSALVKAAEAEDPVVATAVALAALTRATAVASWWSSNGLTSIWPMVGSGALALSP
jgi:hypothetical protein